ncbi:fibronectin type III domain-containing protein [Aliikangiella sp. IMCC44653]
MSLRKNNSFLQNIGFYCLLLPYLITITACGGGSEGDPETTNQDPVNLAPVVTITSPSNNFDANSQSSIDFSATAVDSEDGDLSGSIVWTSDISGELGSGANISTSLSVGTHNITATVTDSGGLSHSSSISVNVNNLTGMASVSWNPPSTNTDDSPLEDLIGFKIYVGESVETLSPKVTIDDPQTYSHVIDELKPNTTYYFAVTAINSQGIESDYSNIANKFTGN